MIPSERKAWASLSVLIPCRTETDTVVQSGQGGDFHYSRSDNTCRHCQGNRPHLGLHAFSIDHLGPSGALCSVAQ